MKIKNMSSDMITYLEIAHQVLQDPILCRRMAEHLDISEDEAKRLGDQLNKLMSDKVWPEDVELPFLSRHADS